MTLSATYPSCNQPLNLPKDSDMEDMKKNSRQFTVARQFTIHKNEISTMSLELRATPEPLAADPASDSDSDMSSCNDLMDDDLQATYDDPPHLSIPPNT